MGVSILVCVVLAQTVLILVLARKVDDFPYEHLYRLESLCRKRACSHVEVGPYWVDYDVDCPICESIIEERAAEEWCEQHMN